jgi:ankyrin repeat protein
MGTVMKDRMTWLAAMGLTLLALMAATSQANAQTAQERLWDASKVGDTLTMANALADGARLDSLDVRRSRNGRFALNYAAWFDHPAAIDWLLRVGATLEAENKTGFTALHHAAENGSLEAARTLLAAGADPEHANGQGWLPAETAADRGHPEVAALIREAMAQE